jgi:hypothetical protein
MGKRSDNSESHEGASHRSSVIKESSWGRRDPRQVPANAAYVEGDEVLVVFDDGVCQCKVAEKKRENGIWRYKLKKADGRWYQSEAWVKEEDLSYA